MESHFLKIENKLEKGEEGKPERVLTVFAEVDGELRQRFPVNRE